MSQWSTVTVTVGADDISNHVMDVDITHEDHFYIARCEITLFNEANEWHTDFDISDLIVISIDGVEMFVGYLDDIIEATDDSGADLNLMTLTGRGTGFNLQNLYYTKNYPDGSHYNIDDIMDDALVAPQVGMGSGEAITYVSPSTAPIMPMKFNRSYLLDKFKEACESANYSGFVDNALAIHFFPYGDVSEHTAVDLVMDGTTDTNILRFKWGEQIGNSIRNYVEFYADSVKDHWTDCVYENTSGVVGLYDVVDQDPIWDNGNYCTLPQPEYTIKMPRGVCSVQFGSTSNSIVNPWEIQFNLPKFNYVTLNLSQSAEDSVWVYTVLGWNEGLVGNHIRPRLRDDWGTVIEWVKNHVPGELHPTEDPTTATWYELTFPQGENLEIKESEETGFWYYKTHVATIDAGVGFTSVAVDVNNGYGNGVLTFTGGTFVPEDDLNVGQKIAVTNSENLNDDYYTVKTLTSNSVIVWEMLDGITNAGTDNAEDTAMHILPGFDWRKVDRISFEVDYSASAGTFGPTVSDSSTYLDFLTLPMVQVLSIQESVASSILYKKRMFREQHNEVRDQNTLDLMTIAELNSTKDPLSTLNVWAMGQVNSKYPGQSLDVQAVPFNINALTKYRIGRLHHKISTRAPIGKLGYNFVTEYDLIEHSVSGATQYTNMRRLTELRDPANVAVEELKNFRDSLADDDRFLGISTYVRIPNDNELRGLGLTGLDANKPATAAVDTFYYATDTMIWYKWDGDSWDETTRAEVKTRLAQLYERAHSSVSNVTTGQHHGQDHDTRHATVGGADAIDTSSASGPHTHEVSGIATTIEDGSVGNHQHLLVTSAFTQSSSGAHTHNVTASPTTDYTEGDDPMVEILSIEVVDDMRVVKFRMPEFNRTTAISFPLDKPDSGIVKTIKQLYHDLWEHKRKAQDMVAAPSSLVGKRIKWDREKERTHLLESMIDNGRDEWAEEMKRSIVEGKAHPDDVKEFEKYNESKDKKKRELGLI